MSSHHLACDLGAESGRLMLGALAGGRLTLAEIHRFPNRPIQDGDSLQWDIPALWSALKAGLKLAAARRVPITSLSMDSWGVDYLLLDAERRLIPPTFHYRDPRTARGVKTALARVDWPAIFAETGIQFMPLNTIFQLAAESRERLDRAATLLSVGDGFNHFLGSRPCVEVSMASTFQLYNPVSRTWSDKLIAALELPRRIFPEIVASGTRLGPLTPEVAAETGLHGIEVIATCSHDTGAAVAGVPAAGADWAYLSSGTWSLMGVELDQPILTDACRQLNFTNEIGYGNSVRLLKNILGLWLVQECRRAWAGRGQDADYATLTRLAAAAPPFVSLMNPADQRFISHGDMPAKIAAFCRETGQPEPTDAGACVRCALESLALLYRRTLREIEQLTGRRITQLHVVGGGSRNALLNQFTANALQIPVRAGPAEATAAGNILLQALALGHLGSLGAAREVVRSSFKLGSFMPENAAAWDVAYERFEKLC